MGPQSERPAADGAASGSTLNEHFGEQLDIMTIDPRRGVQAVTTPKEAVEAMIAAGASFAIQRRADTTGFTFTYRIEPGGDPERAHAILATVKDRPPAFLTAFKAVVQRIAGPIS